MGLWEECLDEAVRRSLLVGFSSCVSTPITASAVMLSERHTHAERPESPGKVPPFIPSWQSAVILGAFPGKGFRGSLEPTPWPRSRSPLGKATCFPRRLLISRLPLQEKGPGQARRGQTPWPRHSGTPLPRQGPGPSVAPNCPETKPKLLLCSCRGVRLQGSVPLGRGRSLCKSVAV